MSQEPEKKETKNPADRFNKVNRKMTIVWTGVAVLVVLAIALGLFFASKGNDKHPEGSGSMEGTVIINDDGQKGLVDEDLYDYENCLDRSLRLVEAARKNGIEVIFMQHDAGPGSGMSAGDEAFEMIDELRTGNGNLEISLARPVAAQEEL